MKTYRYYLKIILAMLLLVNIGCQENEEPNGGNPPVPPIDNGGGDFPFSYLGSGTILFERITSDGNKSNLYMIDLDQKKTWGFSEEIFEGIVSDFKISPDGQTILLTLGNGFPINYQVHTCDLQGKNIKKLVSLEDQTFYPSWSPDGGTVYFWNVEFGDYDNYVLHAVGKDGLSLRPILDFNQLKPGTVTVSSKNKISFATNQGGIFGGTAGIYICNSDGNELVNTIPLIDEGVHFNSPVFSPDGNTLAYLKVWRSWMDGSYQKMEVRALNMNTMEEGLIISVPAGGIMEWNFPEIGNLVYLSWSPDGKKLIFNVPQADYVSYLYVVDADGSNLTKVTTETAVSDRYGSWGR
ncbi:TolB family protein [Shivajiella indica]|uniref:TolB family protein n=1 Tax=Shivajiella indica TaxID=872115 RepID=A0ABW5BC80_9BACT